MFVTVSDGETACDKSTSFDVTCPGVNLCEGVVCEDDGNVCTDAECNQATGECETSNNTNECTAGGGGELTVNGDFETGNTTGWEFFPNDGTFAASSAQANGGTFSGNLVASVPAGGGPPSFPVVKQANIGIGTAQPNSSCDISFDLFGSVSGAGGVFFAEFFSELSGGGTSSSVILGGGPLFPTGTWTNYAYTTPTGDDVSGGVTLQLKADCGANPGCTVDAFIDNVSVTCGSGGGEPGTCSEGMCVPNADCSVAGDCPDDGNECTDATCDAGTCGTSNNTNVCDGGNGTCSAGVCVPDSDCSVAGDCPDDGNECTDAVCDAGACGTSNNTNACDGGAGTCSAGVCEPNASCEYTQNFEALTPGDPPQGQPTDLATDGWLVGGNEFESDGTTPVGSYFAFPAPNGGPAFSAVATGEGGAPQGDQQMSIYNDYNNPNHGDGPPDLNRIIEAVVFQERDLVAADVGNTISFTFDAKVGNIEGASTAEAFIQVLDKLGNSFGVIVDDVQITTNLPATWSTFTLSVPIDASLVGQLLQFGGRSRAANFEGSGILYDNMELCSE